LPNIFVVPVYHKLQENFFTIARPNAMTVGTNEVALINFLFQLLKWHLLIDSQPYVEGFGEWIPMIKIKAYIREHLLTVKALATFVGHKVILHLMPGVPAGILAHISSTKGWEESVRGALNPRKSLFLSLL
jgi:hypothetical protein